MSAASLACLGEVASGKWQVLASDPKPSANSGVRAGPRRRFLKKRVIRVYWLPEGYRATIGTRSARGGDMVRSTNNLGIQQSNRSE